MRYLTNPKMLARRGFGLDTMHLIGMDWGKNEEPLLRTILEGVKGLPAAIVFGRKNWTPGLGLDRRAPTE